MSDRGKQKPAGLPIPIPDADQCPVEYAVLIDDFLCGAELKSADLEKMHQGVADNAHIKAYYDQAALAMRLFEGAGKEDALFMPTENELAGVEAKIFDRLNVEEIASKKEAKASNRFVLFNWIASALAIGAVVALLIPVGMNALKKDKDEFQPRGQVDKNKYQVGFRVFCIDDQADSDLRELLASDDGKISECKLSSTMKFAITNRSSLDYLFLVGVDSRKMPMWYRPIPPATESIEVKDWVDQPMGRAVNLKVNHKAGLLRIFAIFSDKPISSDKVEEAISNLADDDLKNLSMLSIKDTEQRSLLIELKE